MQHARPILLHQASLHKPDAIILQYYYNKATGITTWEKPEGFAEGTPQSTSGGSSTGQGTLHGQQQQQQQQLPESQQAQTRTKESQTSTLATATQSKPSIFSRIFGSTVPASSNKSPAEAIQASNSPPSYVSAQNHTNTPSYHLDPNPHAAQQELQRVPQEMQHAGEQQFRQQMDLNSQAQQQQNAPAKEGWLTRWFRGKFDQSPEPGAQQPRPTVQAHGKEEYPPSYEEVQVCVYIRVAVVQLHAYAWM